MNLQPHDQWQCAGCAVEFPPGEQPEGLCPICADERQYIPCGTQRWIRSEDLAARVHELTLTELEPGLTAISSPEIGIGQSALLVQTTGGNLLFDVPGLLTEQIVSWLNA